MRTVAMICVVEVELSTRQDGIEAIANCFDSFVDMAKEVRRIERYYLKCKRGSECGREQGVVIFN